MGGGWSSERGGLINLWGRFRRELREYRDTLSNGNWRPGIITMQQLYEYLVMISDGHGRFGFWVYVSWLVTNLHSVNAIDTLSFG
jgi:hypothetical protein